MTTTPLYPATSECVFKTLRLDNSLTLAQLANNVGMSTQALIRLEQGTFPRPLEPVIDFWVNNYGYSHLQILDAYDGYRSSQRTLRPRLFGDRVINDPHIATLARHPFRVLRGEFGLTEVAKLLCVPQATLQHFEKKWRTQQSVPRELIAALLENGYRAGEIRTFAETYTLWRNRQLGRIK